MPVLTSALDDEGGEDATEGESEALSVSERVSERAWLAPVDERGVPDEPRLPL